MNITYRNLVINNPNDYGISSLTGSYTISLSLGSSFDQCWTGNLRSSGSVNIPTFGAKKILINSISGCSVSGNESGTLGNNYDISNDTMLTISVNYSSTDSEDSNEKWNSISASGSINLTLEFE